MRRASDTFAGLLRQQGIALLAGALMSWFLSSFAFAKRLEADETNERLSRQEIVARLVSIETVLSKITKVEIVSGGKDAQ